MYIMFNYAQTWFEGATSPTLTALFATLQYGLISNARPRAKSCRFE